MADGIVVATWNLQGRMPERTRIVDAIRSWDADILLFQEAHETAIDVVLPPELIGRQWWSMAGTPPGIGIVSRWELEATGEIPADGRPFDRVRLCWARIQSPIGALTVAAVHLVAPLAPGARRRRDAQREAVGAWAAEAAVRGPVIVGGDFNTIDPRLSSLRDASVRRSPTWRPFAIGWMRPLIRIDAVFVSSDLRATARVADGWRGSDHCPVVARVDLAESGATLRGR